LKFLQSKTSYDYPIPFSPFTPNQEAELCFEHEVVAKDWKHPFTYTINSNGFRYKETDKPKTICFVGCSHTFGHGLPQDKIFPELVTQELGDDWQCINLGFPGSGPDSQMINLSWALNVYDIDVVVWYMSAPMRQAVKKDCIHTFVPPTADFLETKKEKETFLKSIVELEDTTYLKTHWQVYAMLSFLRSKNIKTFYKCWDGKFHAEIQNVLIDLNIVEFTDMKNIDLARDNAHKGPESHRWFSKQLLEVLHEV